MGNPRPSFLSRLVTPRLAGSADRTVPDHARVDVLARVAECLIAGQHVETMLGDVFAIVANEIEQSRFGGYVFDRDGEALVLVASGGMAPSEQGELARRPLDASLCGSVARRRRPVLRERIDLTTDALAATERRLRVRSYAGFPLLAGERALGVIAFSSRRTAPFRPSELTLMQTVAVQVAAAMERLRLERATRDSEARLRLALAVGGMGAWSWEVASRAFDPDPQLVRLHGLDPAEAAVPDADALLARIHPDDRAQVQALGRASVVDGRMLHCDYRVVLPDGGIRWLATHAHPVTDAAERVTSLIGLTEDVTATVAARQGLEREAAALETLAADRGVALAASEARLAEASKMEALGRLAGGIAHDFNNVLQAVEGSASIALRSMENDPETARRFLRLAADACARGASVTERLLAFGRRSPLRAVPLDAAVLLEGLADMLRPTLGAPVAVRVECLPGLPPLLADRNRLEAVLVNLANNARDAMAGGGRLLLAADLAPPTAVGATVRLRVVDEGEGMTPEVLARVSEPFFTTKPMGKGTGLGLAMARGFAEQSGGNFAIESALGRGTTVTLVLPASPAGAAPLSAPSVRATGMAEAASAWPAPAGAAILLVQGRPDLRSVLAAELGEGAHDVTAVADAAAALSLLSGGYRPGAIVADLALAGRRDGLELLAEARRHLPGLPGIVITGHLPDDDDSTGALARSAAAGPFALLHKPVAGEVLRAQLARLLAEHDGASFAAQLAAPA